MGKILKSAASLVTGLALAVSVTAVAELPASAAAPSSCKASFHTYSTIRQGSRGTQTRALECLLDKAGYSVSVNGRFSAGDADKLARYRASVGLSKLRYAGPRPWSALVSRGSTPTLKRGSKATAVLRLQRSLRALGYTKVTLTGYYGTATQSAVKSAQKKRHLKQTGVADAKVWYALQHGRVAAQPVKKKSTNKGAKALAFAKKQIGDRYVYGATGPSAWDCSGLTGGAWKAAGVSIPRTSQAQYRVGRKIAKSDLKPGDLVFFYSGISHVGIYAGGGKVLHASQPSKPVGYLKMSYMPYQGARRPG